MASVISVLAKLQADASGFVSGMKKAEQASNNLVSEVKSDSNKVEAAMGKSGKQAGSGFASGLKGFIGPALFAGAITGALSFGKAIIQAGEAERAQNDLLENIATSMGLFGNQASQVAGRVADYAQAQSLATGVDEDAIKAGQAKLLTFSNIAKTAGEAGGSFDRATKAAMDLSAAGFGSVESASLQMGKALQDPIKGMNALRRSGVTFSESEKETIKNMVASGKAAEAQNIILKAVEMQVGGSAEATATGSARMKAAFENLKENLATGIMPMFDRFAKFMADTVMPKLSDLALKLGPMFEKMGAAVGPVLSTIGTIFSNIFTAMQPAIEKLSPLFAQLMGSFSPFGIILKVIEPLIPQIFGALSNILVALMPAITAIVDGIGQVAGMLSQALGPILSSVIPIVMTFAQMLGQLIPPIIAVLVPVIGILLNALQPIIQVVLMVINVFMTLMKAIFVPLIKVISAVLKPILAVLQVFTAIAKTIISVLMPIIQALIDFISPAFALIGSLADGLASFIDDAMSAIADFVRPILNAIIDGINAVLSFMGQKTLPKLPDKVVKAARKQGEAIGKAKADGEMKTYLKNRNTQVAGSAVTAVQTNEVKAVTKARDKVAEKLAMAKDFAKKITSSLLERTNVTELGGSANSIIDNLKNRIEAFKQYGQQIADLKKLGAGKQVIEQILAAGLEKGGMTAASLIAGGKSAIMQINTLNKEAANVATGVGLVGTDAVFNRGQQTSIANYDITINAGLGANGGDIGKQIVEQIRKYERQNGKLWKPAT
jgi:phage-related protein